MAAPNPRPALDQPVSPAPASLRDRLTATRAPAEDATAAAGSIGVAGGGTSYSALAQRIHQRLLERVDLGVLDTLPPERVREELRSLSLRLLAEEGAVINSTERRRIVDDIENEVLGFGPLEPLLRDPTISDILVNAASTVYVERHGKLELTAVRFHDDAHLVRIVDKIVSRVGRRIDESSPMVDARLPDGSRVNAIIPPLALDGPMVSIRRFTRISQKLADLATSGSLSPAMAAFLSAAVRSKLNIITGGTGAGKTTMLNALSNFIGDGERVITIEDAAELQLQQPHVVRLETRPPNIEGRGEVTQRSLMRNSLRMRPDRIILGEVRGAEVVDMLQAMNTGHEGSMTTIHANTPRDVLSRLENMFNMSGFNFPPKVLRQQISAAIHLILHVSRHIDGRRRVVSIQEVVGMEGDVVAMQEIFQFEQTGITERGEIEGRYRATGIRPKCTMRMRAFGVRVPDEIFDPARA